MFVTAFPQARLPLASTALSRNSAPNHTNDLLFAGGPNQRKKKGQQQMQDVVDLQKPKAPKEDSISDAESESWDEDEKFHGSDDGSGDEINLTAAEKLEAAKDHELRKLLGYGQRFETAGRVLDYFDKQAKATGRKVTGAFSNSVGTVASTVRDTTLSLTEQALRATSAGLQEAHRQVQNYKNSSQ